MCCVESFSYINCTDFDEHATRIQHENAVLSSVFECEYKIIALLIFCLTYKWRSNSKYIKNILKNILQENVGKFMLEKVIS